MAGTWGNQARFTAQMSWRKKVWEGRPLKDQRTCSVVAIIVLPVVLFKGPGACKPVSKVGSFYAHFLGAQGQYVLSRETRGAISQRMKRK